MVEEGNGLGGLGLADGRSDRASKWKVIPGWYLGNSRSSLYSHTHLTTETLNSATHTVNTAELTQPPTMATDTPDIDSRNHIASSFQ